ncbi:hypothetical protein EV639_11413 [Rathayibacter tanaceti]|uniref:Uncharacterized protein n=2 Tax=Rathayibacter tanaceti TaxID=1671680 RepID=A0ACD2XGH1_9MICO|nr:hypothetical protein [Rathayibacter tanaceti]QHC56758.1 hypothetical protein GSU10_14735 [Rathayibacter tanaceti]TCO33730.1 hypothetical protein EV639_11413 [Rathayibacter tanaceti]
MAAIIRRGGGEALLARLRAVRLLGGARTASGDRARFRLEVLQMAHAVENGPPLSAAASGRTAFPGATLDGTAEPPAPHPGAP